MDDWDDMIDPHGVPPRQVTDATKINVNFGEQMTAMKQHYAPAQKKKKPSQGKKNQAAGKAGEKDAVASLLKMGHLRADPIPTKRTYVFAQKAFNGQPLFRQAKMERAKGDIYSMDENGRLCLSEVKSHDKNTLPWGMLTRRIAGGTYHQSENLDGHIALHPRVSAFLIWVRGKETAVLQWPVQGFDKPRTSIKWSDALQWRVNK